jgi:hypothetical protein
MFRTPLCSSSGESIVLIQYLVYVSLCGWPSGMRTCIPDGHPHRVTYTRCRIDTINSPDDEHMSAGNMWRFGINMYKKKCASSWLFTRSLCPCCSKRPVPAAQFLGLSRRVRFLYPEPWVLYGLTEHISACGDIKTNSSGAIKLYPREGVSI